MLASILSLGLSGIEGFVVTTEVNLAPGMPAFDVVGLPDAAVKESRERVRAALRNCGYAFPNGRLTVNLAPADQKKEGPAFDLPIALGVLACGGEIAPEVLGEAAVLGELSLDGAVRGVRGALPMVISALEAGLKRVMLPTANLNEVRCVEGIEILGVSHLKEAAAHFAGKSPIAPIEPVQYAELLSRREHSVDFCHVRGQKSAKRALEIAAAGGHNVLMIGPPGSGKTLMARCLPTILPDMTFQEALEVTRIHSVAGCVPETGVAHRAPLPLAAPHRLARGAGGRRQRTHCPGKFPRRTTACCFWTNCPSTAATCWKRCDSRWRTASSPWRV